MILPHDSKKFNQILIPSLIILSSLLWLFSFRGFVSGRLSLIDDAVSYYDHTKFFLDNLAEGVYPLWNPTWECGSPNEFFLMRIGQFNPFLSLILLMRKLELPHTQSYLIFLTLYYFLGMIGFYLLAKRIYRDSHLAFLAYLLLAFSSLGTRLFDGYFHLVFIPMIWFFYFLFVFSEPLSPPIPPPDSQGEIPKRDLLRGNRATKKFAFLGMTFTLMILVSTYIPFYFMTIFFSFLIFWVIFYFCHLKGIVFQYFGFFKDHKRITLLCLLAFLLALGPGLMVFKQGTKGDVSIPGRHYGATSGNQLGVAKTTVTHWAIFEDLYFSSYFWEDFKRFQYAIFYIPFFAFLLFGIGMITRMNKRLFFLLCWALGIFLMGTPSATGLYSFLFDHIFFFKYFRNLHFFLWFVLLPVFILYVVEQFRLLFSMDFKGKIALWGMVIFLAVIHGALIIFISLSWKPIISTYIVIGLSFLFFLLLTFCFFKRKAPDQKKKDQGIDAGLSDVPYRRILLLLFLFILVILEPLEVYHYFDENSYPFTGPSRYDLPYMKFSYLRGERPDFRNKDESEPAAPKLYFATERYAYLVNNLEFGTLSHYLWHKFVVYDQIEIINEANLDLRKVEKALAENQNVAFVSLDGQSFETDVPQAGVPKQALRLTEATTQLQVLKFNMNMVKLQTNFPTQKFLVYNDNYHKGWQALINSKKVPLYRSNLSFKGLWIPQGEQMVVLHYGSWTRYALNYFILGVFHLVLGLLIWLGIKSTQELRPNI